MSVEKSCLKLYIGTPREDGMDYLYLDLAIPSREICLWSSKEELNDCSGDDFLELLEDVLNEASLWIRALGLRMQIDTETILQIADDYSERVNKDVVNLLKEIRENKSTVKDGEL